MARRKPEYPNTSWGREAEWEDIQAQAEPERKQRETEEYDKTYAAAKKMLEEGKKPQEIAAALDVPAEPEFMTQGGIVPQWAKVKRSVEESMVYVRQKAIADALASGDQKKGDNEEKSE
jgi:hypothetical protein